MQTVQVLHEQGCVKAIGIYQTLGRSADDSYAINSASAFCIQGLQPDDVVMRTGCVGKGAVVVGAATAEANANNSVHGAVERQAACAIGSGGNPSRSLG